ncbi:hypothetical protein [Cupriavidus metallidurans]|uniref:hypothetical protein n=1 Tax=Cupriavidus metallidurans TaxID=119219 RepID=UPI00055AA591|nr:hypothetical protein [Cupriavidus metallidurans]
MSNSNQMNGQYVAPPFMGDYLDIQRKQALAQALMGNSLQNQGMQLNQIGAGMRVMPRVSPLSGVAQLAQALLSAKLGNDAIDAQRDLGQRQTQWLTGTPTTQDAPDVVPADQQQTPLSYGVGSGGGFTQGGPDARTTMLANALQGKQAAYTGGFLAAGSPMNPAGLPENQAAYLYQTLGPEKYNESYVAPYYKPTEATLMARGAGADPRAANAAMLTKNTYIAPTEGRPGGWTIYPDGRRVWNPEIPKGGMPAYDAQGNVIGALPLPGATDVTQGQSSADARGKARYNVMAGVDESGRPVYTTAENVADGYPGQTRPGGQGGVNAGRFGGYQAPSGGAVRPGLSPAESEGQKIIAEGNARTYNDLRTQASNAADRTNMLDAIETAAMGSTKYGPGWSKRLENLAAINSRLPSDWQFGSDDTSNAIVMQKMASNLIQQYQRTMGGTGTDKQMELVMHGTPGADMTNKAILEVVPKLKAMEAALQAKASAADSWLARNNNNPASLNQFESVWRKNYDPQIYQFQQISPAEQAAALNRMTPAQAAEFGRKLSFAKQNGWVQ